jgi:Ca-activated chloride channel family protein
MLDSGGGTEIYQGLAAGYSQLELRTVRKSIRHILLMTDGHTYGDEPECLELARRSMSEGIIISGLGLGHEWNDKFLDQIASLSGGATQFVSKPSDLMNMLERKIHDIGMVYARGVALEFKGDNGVELRDAFRLHPESGPLRAESPISFGNLQYGRSLTVLLEFQLGPMSQTGGKIRLAEGRLKMEIPSRDETVRIPMNLSRPISAMPSPETPPAQIVEAMSKLILYRMQERARMDIDAGDIVRGTRRLQYLATHLLAQGDRELARTVLTEAEHIQRSKQYSEDGDKRIKYGTKLLLLPSGMEHKNDSMSEL